MTSWFGTIGVGIAVGVVGLVVGGWLASRAVDWYNVPSREGGSAYFVMFQALFALVAGLIIGVIVSRVVVSGGGTQLKALLLGGGAHLLLLAVIGTVARLMADVPPSFEGERLMLAVEVSWPEASAPSLPSGDILPYVGLAAASGNTTRVGRQGPLWAADARHENGRLIVPGAVEIFTSRGKRLLFVNTGTRDKEDGLVLPLPAYPGKAQRTWSEWMPRARSGTPALPDGIRYRFRVVKRNEPIRTQHVGAFDISTVARKFTESRYAPITSDYAADADFQVSYKGTPVTVEGRTVDQYIPDPWKPDAAPPADAPVQFDRIIAVATIPGAEPALVVEVEYRDSQYRSTYDYLLQAQGDRLRTTFVSAGGADLMARRLSRPPDNAPPEPVNGRQGYIDDRILAVPGLYLFPRAVLDTRSRTVQAVSLERTDDEILKIGPLSLSPDEKHFARLIRNSENNSILMEQVTIADNARRTVPTGFATTSTGNWQDADRSYFDNYFAWESTAGGGYRVTPKAGATTLPHRGTLKEQVGYREYRVSLAKESLRDAFIADLTATYGATLVPTAADAYAKEVRINGEIFNLSYSDEGEVGIWMENHDNTLPMVKLSRHLDSLLATRRLDAHFKKPDAPQ
ncbi:MAG: hypothetical protein IPP90_13470 [Gemmatimonadaceae bacterium]|nr:hypothetical protein [Gemmatimonadaceae bacterium]